MTRIKDGNDLLQAWNDAGFSAEEQMKDANALLEMANPFILVWADDIAKIKNFGEKNEALKTFFTDAVHLLDKQDRAGYKNKICSALEISKPEWNERLKILDKTFSDNDNGSSEKKLPIVEMLGGWIPDGGDDKERGYYVEYLYDPDMEKAIFAYKDPDGDMKKAPFLDVNGFRYVPIEPKPSARNGAVVFPSDLGELQNEKELAFEIEKFLRKYVFFDTDIEYRLSSYYVLLTWLFDLFPAIPYFRARGKTDTGKSEVMLRLGHLCYRLIISTGISTTASYKNAIDFYKGTIFLDEMDISDKDDARIVLLNVGAMKKQANVWKLVEIIRPDGTRTHDEEVANVYGPKLITMYGRFKDDATESRCLTLEMLPHSPIELKKKSIPLELPPAFYVQARLIRNKLLSWRLSRWQRDDFQMGDELTDYSISTRLNQVTRPLKYIAKDDPAMLEEVEKFVQLYNGQITFERSQSLDARVLDAVVGILFSEAYEKYLHSGSLGPYGSVNYAFTRDIAVVANDFMDAINMQDPGDGEEVVVKKNKKGITTHTASKICRTDLQLKSHRLGTGFVIILDQEKVKVMMTRYGAEMPGANVEILETEKEDQNEFNW